jgi:hypothetical protein
VVSTNVGAAACARPARAYLSARDNSVTELDVTVSTPADQRAETLKESTPPPTATVSVDGLLSWAYLNRVTGDLYTSPNVTMTSFTESMVKAWIAADELSRAERSGRQPNLRLIVPMVRDSDDYAAQALWLNNGADGSIVRMIQTCHLTDTRIFSGWWSKTLMSARDAVRLGECIASGVAAGPQWTSWLMDEMRQVRGEGRFGIIDAVDPIVAPSLAIKNGWTMHFADNRWRVNCLAIERFWILAVMMVYPRGYGLDYGAQLCASVARQVVPPLPVPPRQAVEAVE